MGLSRLGVDMRSVFAVTLLALTPACGRDAKFASSTLSTAPLAQLVDGPAPVPTLPEGQAGTLELALNEVFDQGDTDWCWAYSSFHTLKTYFTHLPHSDNSDVEALRIAVQSIKTNDDLRSLLGKYVSTDTRGSPYQFLNILKGDKDLKNVGAWDNLEGRRSDVMMQVVANIRKGIPAGFCYGGHCVAINGFTTDGTNVTEYSIADSVNSQRYKRDADWVQNNYWAIWTLPGDIAQDEASIKAKIGSFPASYSDAVDPYKKADHLNNK